MKCSRCGSDRHNREDKRCCNCQFFIAPNVYCKKGFYASREGECSKHKYGRGICSSMPLLKNHEGTYMKKELKIILPNEDCIAVSIIFNGKQYSGFRKINFNNKEEIENTFKFFHKTTINTIKKGG